MTPLFRGLLAAGTLMIAGTAMADLTPIAATLMFKNLSVPAQQGIAFLDSDTGEYFIPAQFIPDYIAVQTTSVPGAGIEAATPDSFQEIVYEPSIGVITIAVSAASLPINAIETQEAVSRGDYQEQFAVQGRFSSFGSKRDDEKGNYTSALELAFGLPYAGKLKTGVQAVGSDGDTDVNRLITSLQHDFNDYLVSVEAGEQIRSAQNNGRATLLNGLSLFSNYGLQPGRNYNPEFDYLLELDSASKVRVLQNNAELFTTSTDQAARLQLQGLQSSTSGDITLAIEDVNGETRLITVPYFVSNTTLNEGQLRYSVAAGEQLNSDLSGTGELTGIGRLAYGFPKRTTAELFTQVSQEDSFDSNAVIAGYTLNNINDWGLFDLTYSESRANEQRGYSVLFSYRRQTTIGSQLVRAGFNYQRQDNYFDGARFDNFESARLFANTFYGPLYLGGSYLFVDEGDDLTTVNLGYVTQDRISLNFSATSDMDDNHLGKFTVSVPLGRGVSGSARTSYDSSKTSLSSLSLNGYNQEHNLAASMTASYRAQHATDTQPRSESDLYFATASQNNEYSTLGYVFSHANGQNLHQGSASTAFAYVPGVGFDVDRAYGIDYSVGALETGTPNLELITQGKSFVTDDDGDAVFPIIPNSNMVVRVDPNRDRYTSIADPDVVELSAKAGYAARASMVIPSTPAIIAIEADRVAVNGQPAQHVGIGFFSDNLVNGKNTLTVDGQTLVVNYRNTDGIITEYIVDDGELSPAKRD